MICTACNKPLNYRGNSLFYATPTKIYGCSGECPAISEANYNTTVEIRDGWHFLHDYHLPFKSKNKWYILKGPYFLSNSKDNNNPISVLDEMVDFMFIEWVPDGPSLELPHIRYSKKQKQLISIPYMSLPSNEDFEEQFEILKKRAFAALNDYMSEAQRLELDKRRRKKHADKYL